jgi:rRNA maturation RNase YbeY
MSKINFFNEETDFSLKQKTKLRSWISSVLNDNHKHLISLNYIYTSDEYLLKINKEYLNHDTFTDIVTFDQSTQKDHIEADIYISIDRIKDNAHNLNIPIQEELHRVMIHGVLHLIGFGDKTETEKKEMRKKENHYLALRL